MSKPIPNVTHVVHDNNSTIRYRVEASRMSRRLGPTNM